MLTKLPRQYPPLWLMLDDIGNPKPRELARAFAVSESTARAWIKADAAPVPVMLAIFWLTRWGQSAVNCDAVNDAMLQAAIAANLRRQVGDLTARLDRLGRIADFGAANDPAPGVALPIGQEQPSGDEPKPLPAWIGKPATTAKSNTNATVQSGGAVAELQEGAC